MAHKSKIFSYKTAEQSPGFLLWQATSLWHRNLNALLKKHGLTHAQFVILASAYWLGSNASDIKQAHIAGHAKMDAMMVSNVLRTLEKKKLLRRSAGESDTRSKSVQVRPQGVNLLRVAAQDVESFDRTFFSRLGKNCHLFRKQLSKLTQSMD